MRGTILLDESSLDRALQKRGGTSRMSNAHHSYIIHATSISSNPNGEILLDEDALSQALQLKAEQRRSRARSSSRSPSRNSRTLPRRRSRSRSKSRKSQTDKSLQKSTSYKSEGSSTHAESTSPTIASRSSHSHSESIDVGSNHSSSAGSPARGRTRSVKEKPSHRSKSEPSRHQPRVVPMFHVHTDTRDPQLQRPSVSESVVSEPIRPVQSSDEVSVEKRSFFRQTVAPDSVMQPVDYIDSPHSEDFLATMGGSQVVEMIVARFLLTALEKPEVSAYIDQFDDDVGQLVHNIEGEFVTLGNMAMTDDFEELAGMLPFHYHLVSDGFNMDLISELWTDAYENVWMNYDVDDSRQLAGPSHAVFNLNLLAKLYHRRMRARRWDQLMEKDEKRIEELKELRRRRRSRSRDKRRQRRARSVDTFLHPFRRSQEDESDHA